MSASRFAWGLAGALALLAVAAESSSAARLSLHRSAIGVTRLLILDRRVEARAAPDPVARVVGHVPVWTPLTRSRMTLPVITTANGPGGGLWVHVRLPMRPDGATGWVPADSGTTASSNWTIVIHRADRRAVVLHDGKAQASFAVVLGKPSTPTPLGTYFVVEKLRLAPGVMEGPWALATSAYSDVLQQYAGGDGQVALHGTVGMSAPLGSFSSHGCVRFAPAAISWIANRVGRGTPVIVTR